MVRLPSRGVMIVVVVCAGCVGDQFAPVPAPPADTPIAVDDTTQVAACEQAVSAPTSIAGFGAPLA